MSAPVPAELLRLAQQHIDLTVGILRATAPVQNLVTVDDLFAMLIDQRGISDHAHREILAAVGALALHRLAFQ